MAVTRGQSNRNTCDTEVMCTPRNKSSTSRSRPRRLPVQQGDDNSSASTTNQRSVTPAAELCRTESNTSSSSVRCSAIRCLCFYFFYLLTCVLLSIVIYSVLTSYSKTLRQIEDLKSEIFTLRNEVLANQQFEGTPYKPPAIDSNLISNDLIQIIDSSFARETQKIMNELAEIKAMLGKMNLDGTKSYDVQFDLILKRLDEMQQSLSKPSPKAISSRSFRGLGNQQVAEDRVDYAAESLGGEILSTDDTQLLKMYYFGSIFGWIENTPRMIIQPSIFPGECYGFAGQMGSVVIKLMARVFIDSVTIGHIPRELSPSGDLNTAPRDIIVSGLTTPDDTQPTELAKFVYDINKTEVFQTFPVTSSVVSFQFVRFNFTTNYGNLNHTCVYRVRVHGKLDET